METLRRKLAADPNIYPELAPARPKQREESPQIISIGSSSSSSSSRASPPPKSSSNANRPITIDSDSDDEDGASSKDVSRDRNDPRQGKPHGLPAAIKDFSHKAKEVIRDGAHYLHSKQQHQAYQQPTAAGAMNYKQPAYAHAYPSGLPGAPGTSRNVSDSYAYPTVHASVDDDFLSPADTEKAIRDLMGDMDKEDVQAEINEDDRIVKGFKEGIKLLPHQVIGRQWMKEREDVTRKRFGGILADDMGLGKTIQTLTRIVEGKPKRSDKEDGWAASTLIVCPLALLGQWASEIKKMCVGITTVEHHGTSRTSDPEALKRAHVVLTTYDVVKSEYGLYETTAKDEAQTKLKKKKNSSDDSDSDERPVIKPKSSRKLKTALFGVKWWRIVLDEGHNIKNKATKASISCSALEAKFRWVLSGTPLQNDVTELYSLFRFLRIKPYNDWTMFNEQIAKPVKSGRGGTRAMKRLQVVLKGVMLRRKKTDSVNGVPLIELPGRHVEVLSCPFSSIEQTFYTALETKMEVVLKRLMQKGGNYTSVLVLLLRLRQACDHPFLVSKDYKKDIEGIEPAAVKEGNDVGATDADDLIAAFGKLGVTRNCQMCQIELTESNCSDRHTSKHCEVCAPLAQQAIALSDSDGSSAKIRMIVKLLTDVKERSGGEEKTIIFSQFTSMLDLIQPVLREEGFRFVRYDGSMSKEDREESLDQIKTNPKTQIILVSFKAGSTGLNLTACNNVILVDIWWNPALEDQAFDRAHRFGQERDVNIWKLKVDATVEDRILELQDKKRMLAAAALSGDKIKNMKLGMNELLALFRPGGRDDDEEDSDED